MTYGSGPEVNSSPATNWAMGAVSRLLRKPPNMYTFVAAAISVGSFATTFAGFNMFFGGWSLFAFPVAFVVQLFVFHFSMEFGRLLNGDVKGIVQVLATLVMLPVMFVVSFGFSAVFFWDGVFTGDQEQQAFTTNVQTEVAAQVERMAQDRDAAGDEALDGIREQVTGWERSVFLELDRIAGDNQANVESIIRQQINEKNRVLDDEKAERNRLIQARTGALEATQATQFQIESLEAEADTLQTAIDGNVEARAQKLVEKTDAENEAQAELDGTGQRAAGEGPLYRDAIQRAEDAKAEADRFTEIIAQQQQDLVALRSQITTLQLSTGTGENSGVDDSELQAIDTRINDLEREIRGLQADLRLEQSQGDGGNSGFINILKNQPTDEAYTAALGRCEASLQFYREQGGEVAQQASAITCAQPSLERSVDTYASFQAGAVDFAASCGTQTDNFRTIDGLDKEGALAYGRECLNLAQLSIATAQDYRTFFGSLEREQDAGAFLITRALQAWENRESTLISSVVVAFGIDFLIFVAGYLATQNQHTRVTKNLRSGELSDILHKMWKVDFDPKPDDPKGILLSKLVIAQLKPIANGDVYVREMNLTRFKEELFKAEQQGVRRGLVAGFNVGFGEWIRKYGKIEPRWLDGIAEEQDFLKVREEFINYFAKQVYDHETLEGAGLATAAASNGYSPTGSRTRRLANTRLDEGSSRFKPLYADADDDEAEDEDGGEFSARKFAPK